MWGLMALRLADPAVLPFNYTDYGVALSDYAQQMKSMLTNQGAAGKRTSPHTCMSPSHYAHRWPLFGRGVCVCSGSEPAAGCHC
jgi:hypothetical protein